MQIEIVQVFCLLRMSGLPGVRFKACMVSSVTGIEFGLQNNRTGVSTLQALMRPASLDSDLMNSVSKPS